MRISVLLNAMSGATRGQDAAALAATIRESFAAHGRQADVELIHPGQLRPRLEALRDGSPSPDAIVVGGGDGSISTGGQVLAGSDIALGVLPLGTFNLFARAIEMPLDLSQAVAALGAAMPVKVDTMQVNGRTVLQHASIGIQPHVVLLREKLTHESRIGKIAKGALAWMKVLRRPPRLALSAETARERIVRGTPAVLISNNAMRSGLGEAPVAEDLHRHRIAIYLCTSRRRVDLVKLTLAAPLGLWREAGLIEEIFAREVQIDSHKRRLLLSLDGELVRLDTPLVCRNMPDSLTVLMPQAEAGSEAT